MDGAWWMKSDDISPLDVWPEGLKMGYFLVHRYRCSKVCLRQIIKINPQRLLSYGSQQ